MRVTLVNMPWQSLSWPSLSISVLDTLLAGSGHQVTQYYGNLRFAEYLLKVSDGQLTPDDYFHIHNNGFAHGVGEWAFTSALYGPGWKLPCIKQRFSRSWSTPYRTRESRSFSIATVSRPSSNRQAERSCRPPPRPQHHHGSQYK
jgi:hypothetical protein